MSKPLHAVCRTTLGASLLLALLALSPAATAAELSTDVLIAGAEAEATTHSMANPLLIRANAQGDILWERPLPLVRWGASYHRFGSTSPVEPALYLASFSAEDQVDGKNRILKFDGDGGVIWDHAFSAAETFVSANPLEPGVYALEVGLGGALSKLDGDGFVVWRVGVPELVRPVFVSADPVGGGAYVADYDGREAVKFDAGGSVVWRVSFPDVVADVRTNPVDGGVYVGWAYRGHNTSRLDADGNVLWTLYRFPSRYVYGRAVSPVDGSLYLGSGWPGKLARVAMDGTVLFNIFRPNYNPYLAAAVDAVDVYLGDYAERGVYRYDGNGEVVWNRQYGPASWIGYYGIVGIYTGIASAPLDGDADGVADPSDLCPGTPPGEVVDPADGCSIQQVCPCDGPPSQSRSWKNHGRYVSCTARTAERFLELGLIGAGAKEEIVSAAAESRCGHR